MLPRFVTISAVTLALVGTVVGTGIASAHSGVDQANGKPAVEAQHFGKKHPLGDMTKEQREALKAAMESCDYNAWKTIVGDKPITEKINEGNFARFCEATKLLREGKVDEAHAIFKELGVKPPHFGHRHHRPGHGNKPGQSGQQAPQEQPVQ